MERNIENELMEVKRDIATLRDNAVSAKAMMSNAEAQIKEHILSLAQLIEEEQRPSFNEIAETLQSDLTSVEASEKLVVWIENYVNVISARNTELIDELKASIETWKQIAG